MSTPIPNPTGLLLQAWNARAKAEAKPMTDAIDSVVNLLADFTGVVNQQAQHNALALALTALGETAPPCPVDVPTKVIELRTALHDLLALLPPFVPAREAPPPEDVASPPPPEPSAPITLPPPPPSGPRAPTASEEDARLRKLVGEFEDMDRLPPQENGERMSAWVQAIVAEARLLISGMPAQHPLQDAANHLIRRCGGLVASRGVKGFIRGLARNHQDNWAALALVARRRLATLDVEAAAINPKAEEAEEEALAVPADLPLPLLRGRSGVILLVGNMNIDEKLVLFRQRFGFDAEWAVATDSGHKVDVIQARIRQNNLRAVLICEGFMDHNATQSISNTCNIHKVPWAFAGKGGVGKLATALRVIERDLAAA